MCDNYCNDATFGTDIHNTDLELKIPKMYEILKANNILT